MSLKVEDTRRRTCIWPVSTGSLAPKRGRVARKARTQEDRLDHVAARLLQRQRRQFAVIERTFGHDAVDAEAELSGYLRQRKFGNGAIAAALMRQQTMGVLDGALASLDGDIHASISLRDKPRGARYGDNGIVGHQDDIDAAREQRVR